VNLTTLSVQQLHYMQHAANCMAKCVSGKDLHNKLYRLLFVT